MRISKSPLVGIISYTLLFVIKSSPAFAPALQKSGYENAIPFTVKSALTEANRLSWVDNWTQAAPFYRQAEVLAARSGDMRNQVYARTGRLFATATSWTEVWHALHAQLQLPIARKDPRLRLWCLALSGYVDSYLNTSRAKREWEEALELAEKLGDRRWTARATGELGIVAFFEGNASHAVSLVGKALLSAATNGDSFGEARLLAMVGNAFNEMHRFAEAHWFFTHAITVMKQTGDAGYPFDAVLGDAEALAGDNDQAQAREVLRAAISTAEEQHRYGYLADALVHFGELDKRSSDLNAAKQHLQKAVDLAQQVHLYRVLAAALVDLADTDRMEGDLQGAEAALTKALSVSRRVGDRYYLPRDLTAAAELKLAEHRPAEADRLFGKAERVIENIVLNQHSDLAQASLAGAMSDTYLKHFHLVNDRGDASRAFQLVEHVRGRVAASRLKEPFQDSSDPPKRVALEANIATLQAALLGTTDPQIRSQLEDSLVRSERSLAFEENALPKKWKLLRPASLALLQRALSEDELLLEYVLDEPKASCIAVTREDARIIELPEGSKGIETLVRRYLQNPKERITDAVAADLGRLLVEPVEQIYPKQRLIIVPDGILHFLPFEALRDGHRQFLVQSKIVSYAPSGTAVWVLRHRHEASAPGTLLAVGDVDYSTRESTQTGRAKDVSIVRDLSELSSSRLRNLPESRREVLSISRIAGPKSKVLLGHDATESAFKAEAISGYRIIHLAVHAIADSHFPDRSALVLGAGSGNEDGLLQLREIERLHLRADLVTLSACQTAVGPIEGEAGVISLQIAFLMGGARTVVASLWNVEDESTTLLMEAFYRHLMLKEDKAAALAHAKRELLERNFSPYYWAGFVLVGEGADGIRLDQK